MPARTATFPLLLLLLAGAAPAVQTPAVPTPAPSPPPCASAEHRQLDFWLGEWDVRGARQPRDAPPSRSRIERVENGCVIYEQYTTPGGYSGRSLNAYDAGKKRWEQFWVDTRAASTTTPGTPATAACSTRPRECGSSG